MTNLLAALLLLLLAACAPAEADGCASDDDCPSGQRCVAGACVTPPPVVEHLCGDGALDPGEACDEGAGNSDDAACDVSCNLTSCGDGRVQGGRGEACDDGPANDDRFGTCREVCQENRCGDGVVDFSEACDDGAGNSDLHGACTQRCTIRACGDGVVAHDESCDGGEDCTEACTLRGCGARRVVASNSTTLVLLDDGRLVGAGRNVEGQLGVGRPAYVPAFVELFPGVRFTDVEQQYIDGVAITADGALVAWGDNWLGALGRGHGRPVPGLVTLAPGPGWVGVAVGGFAVFALKDDGSVWGAGLDLGRFAEGTATEPCWDGQYGCVGRLTQLVAPGSGFVALRAGHEHLAALDREGRVLTWGCGPYGQLGDGLAEERLGDCSVMGYITGQECRRTPTPVLDQRAPAVALSTGWAATSWLDRDGRLFSTGANCAFALGFGVERAYPAAQENRLLTAEGEPTHALALSQGTSFFSLARDDADQTWVFGNASDVFDLPLAGVPQRLPAPPDGGRFEFVTGVSHALARADDGRVFFAGSDLEGQAGDGEPVVEALGWRPLELSAFCGCGDARVDATFGETCDEGAANAPEATCTPACSAPACGDGFLQPAHGEACDDGPANDDRRGACTRSCAAQRCGDGAVEPGEACDDGGGNSDALGACTQGCTLPRCGDGVRGPGEACDGTPGCGVDCRPAPACGAAVTAGHRATLVLLHDGRLLGTGDNYDGGLGQPMDEPYVTTLRELFPGALFRTAAQAWSHGAGIDPDGRLVTWGANWAGQRGLGHLAPVGGLTIVDGAHRYLDVAVGDTQTFALREDGAVIGFGLALPSLLDGPGGVPHGGGVAGLAHPDPTQVLAAGTGFVAIEAGTEHVVALDRDGVVQTFGCGSWGALGRGTPIEELAGCVDFAMPTAIDCRREPGPIGGQQAPAVSIAAMRAGSLFVERTGALRGAGTNCYGPLGGDLWQPFSTPLEPPLPPRDPAEGPQRFVEAASGGLHHALARTADGRLIGWGQNLGQLANERFGEVLSPLEVPPPPGEVVLQLAAGFAHVVALGADGRVFAAGLNQQGQLALGAVDDWYRGGWFELDLAPFCGP